jgi:hypothetical protein
MPLSQAQRQSPWHQKVPAGWTFRHYSRYRRARLLHEGRLLAERASLKTEIKHLQETLQALTEKLTKP